MTAIDVIKRRLKEDRVPDVPDKIGEKKKRPREVAFMDVNLCFPCGKCPEFCPVQCIEYLARLIPYLEGACSRYRIAFRSASAVTSA
jgi:ferredoxin